MSEAQLKIIHTIYPIKGKADAFWYNFFEGLGRASGWIVVIALVVLFIKYVDPDAPDTAETQIEATHKRTLIMAYATRTEVPVSKSKTDIEKLVRKYGASSFGIMQQDDKVQLAFRLMDRNILFRMIVPEGAQKERTIWRALLLTIKAKCESAESGIETFEEAFMANVVMPDGRTVSDTVTPGIESGYAGNNVPLLPSY